MEMKKRNIYKDIVFLALGLLMVLWTAQGVEFWKQQQETFTFHIQSQTELTESVTEELEKIAGLYEFMPTAVCSMTLKLEEYTMEAQITGIDLKSYPLNFNCVQEKFERGSAPVLFFGRDTFQGFTDINGNMPGQSQISEWSESYQELEVYLTQESGQELRGRICGILKEPSAGIYMDGEQMREVYGKSAKITGGVVKIKGKQKMEHAAEILKDSGFAVE